MAAATDRIPTLSSIRAQSPQYWSANPPRVRQSAKHRAFVDEMLPSIALGSPSAQKAFQKIALCGTWNGISFDRYGDPARYRCELRTCPYCGTRWKTQTAGGQKRKVEELLQDDFSNARRVTLNVRNVRDSQVPFVVEMFRDLLSKLFQRKLPDCVLIGAFDFAFESSATVNVHVHANLIDLSGRITSSVDLLEREFNEDRCFCAQPLSRTLKDGRNGPLAWSSYAVDACVTAYKHHRIASWEHHELSTPADHLRWIGLFEDLRNAKGNRIRTTINFGVSKALKRLRNGRKDEDQTSTPPVPMPALVPVDGEIIGGMYYSSDSGGGFRRPDRGREGGAASTSIRPARRASAGVTCRVPHATTARGPP